VKAEIERIARLDSLIHRWDARWKLVAFALFVLAAAAVDHPWIALLALGISCAALLPCGLPFRLVLRRMAVVHFFLIPCVVILSLTAPGDPVRIGFVTWSHQGMVLASTLYLRALAIVTASLVLIYSTPMNTLLRAGERLRIPNVLIQIALLTYRYLFTLGWELDRIRLALVTRGFRYRTSRQTYRTLANVVGVMLVHSLERADRVYRAMQCRGYSGSIPSWTERTTTVGDVIKFSFCVFVSVLLIWLDT